MNSEQLASLFRTVGQIGGTLLASYGYGTAGQWETISGTLLTLGLTAWSVWSNRSAGLVAKAASLPAVSTVTVSDPALAVAANKSAAGAGTVVAR